MVSHTKGGVAFIGYICGVEVSEKSNRQLLFTLILTADNRVKSYLPLDCFTRSDILENEHIAFPHTTCTQRLYSAVYHGRYAE